MPDRLATSALEQLFLAARTHAKWDGRPVADNLLHELVETMKMAPTSANCQPLRIVFVKSASAKQRLEPLMSAGNRDKTMAAPVTAILGADLAYFEHMPKLWPKAKPRDTFVADAEGTRRTALLNAHLQIGYFILCARALGLDTGPMAGFDTAGVDNAFFAGTAVKSQVVCNIGHGDRAQLTPRNARLAFAEIAQIL
jgi:3-hydroxypropanoate dehydrogenase